MSVEPAAATELAGSDAWELGAGEVLEAITGEVLVFGVADNGRRMPLASVGPGGIVCGCDPTPDRIRLLVTGRPGTTVRRGGLADFMARDADGGWAIEAIEGWIFLVGQACVGGRWVHRVVAPGPEGLRLAPGESVSTTADDVPSSNQAVLGWLRVTSGSARFCGWQGAELGVLDPPVPMTRGVWLTSGLRCRIATAPAPQGLEQWHGALNLIGRLAVEAAVASQTEQDLQREQRLLTAQAREIRHEQEGIDLLAGSVIGPITRPTEPADLASSALAAAFLVARSGGLVIDEAARARAHQEVELGRDPLVAAAESCTARARSIDLSSSWWEKEGPPLVGELKRGGFVAMAWHGKGWTALDPAAPTRRLPVDAAFAALLCDRGTELVPILAPVTTDLRTLLALASARSRREMAAIVILTVGIAGLAFFTPYVFGQIAGSFGVISMTSLVTSLAALMVLLLVTTSWEFVRSLAMLRIRVTSTAIAAGAVWDRMMRLRSTWHDRHSLGDRMTQSSAVITAAGQVPDASIAGLLDSVAVLGSLAAIATTTGPLLAAVAALLAVQIAVNLGLVRRGARLMIARVSAGAAANGRLIETLGAVNRLRVSGAEDRAFRRWAQVHARLTKADLSVRRLMTVQGSVIGAWPLIGLIVIVVVTGISGATFSEFVTAQTAAGIATATIAVASMSAGSLLSAQSVLQRLDPVLEAVPEGFGQGVNPGVLSGAVTFRDITFRYEPSGAPVLSAVSFTVNPGEHVAIVGPSGSGKTTLMRILLGLEDAESGVISVDGKDLASLDRPSVRRQMGSVLQSSRLLPGSIRDNLDMGRGLTSSEMWTALESASVADDVRAMGLGLDTPVVDGGGTISGGQRQRLLIARALAGSPRMLVLDEATSALDNITQGIVVEFLESLRLTRIVIAHRLSTIKAADRIIVLVGGRVAQEGTYEELLSAPGHFKELAERQMA